SIIINITVESLENEWLFCVEDNGIGIPLEFQQKIFIVFQRLYNSCEYEGTGIGLALCEKIVTRHGGKIWVESEIGKGAKFYFTLLKIS
ncbi:ATP-binding protein, partial [Geminocystis sp. GBBB08]|uniref:sensor histidine kinase n=1 Tax=Geminocystis sp. GBBB08 TaxID=2604140 RepID=UPI0027E317CA